MSAPSHRAVRFMEKLNRVYGLTDLFGILVGYVIGKGLLTATVSSPYFLIPLFVAIIVLGTIAAILKGAKTLFQMAGYVIYSTVWLMGLLTSYLVGLSLDILYESQNIVGVLVFVTILVPYLYTARTKHRLGRQIGLDSDRPHSS